MWLCFKLRGDGVVWWGVPAAPMMRQGGGLDPAARPPCVCLRAAHCYPTSEPPSTAFQDRSGAQWTRPTTIPSDSDSDMLLRPAQHARLSSRDAGTARWPHHVLSTASSTRRIIGADKFCELFQNLNMEMPG